jgi:heterodisulfide reductase subunit C
VNCYNCHERCPQQVKPVEVIISMKNMLAERGFAPTAADKVINTFLTSGRTVPPSPAIDKQRAKYGLPPLPPVPMEEIAAIVEPAEEGGVE